MGYTSSIFALTWAYVCYKAYINGLDLKWFGGKGFILYLLINPVIGVIMAAAAIFHAWELSLMAIIGAVLYFTYLGIAVLPVSVAIIIGSIIIAYGIYKYKA